jgi:putative tryptophan/tyrosine transport system substrate-binding protein
VKRREFITLLGGAAASSPFVVHGQALDAFLEGMRTLGYIEGRDFKMDYRWREGHLERMSMLAKELVGSKPDLILAAIMPAVVAARAVTEKIPIVCPLLADPVRLGLVKERCAAGRHRDRPAALRRRAS